MKAWRWLRRWLERRAVESVGSDLRELLGERSSAGIAITPDSALAIAAVFTSVRIIGGTLGSLPMHVFRRDDAGGRELARRHWAYPLLHISPNRFHTAMSWRELIVTHVLVWGNSYNRIEWLGNGAAGALYPLMPWNVEPKLTKGGERYYELRVPGGHEDLADYEVLHVPGLSYDGARGMSVVGKMRDSLGLAKASEDFGAQFFANGAKVGGVLEVPGKMDPEAQKNLVASLTKELTGKEGAFKTIVLEEGAKFHGSNMMPLKDAQFLEIRKFQRSEIFGWYGLPPHLGGDTERQTSWGTGIEQMDIGYAKHTITPLCVRIEQELNRKLFGASSDFYCKHALDGLLRGDFKSRMEGLQIAIGRPWMSVNEGRQLSDMNRLTNPDYDEIALPLNTGVGAAPSVEAPAGARSANGVPVVTGDLLARDDKQLGEYLERGLRALSEKLVTGMAVPPVEVHVEAIMPEQPPPVVTVNLPARKSVSEVERNHKGEITKITQLEKDA